MKTLQVLILAVLIVGCGSATNTPEQQEQVNDMIGQRRLYIESDFALPLVTNSLMALNNTNLLGIGSTANRINLVGNPNFLEVKGDSVRAYLPYFGERRMGGGYGQNNAIEFEGIPDDLEFFEKDGKVQVNFTVDSKENIENYQVNITVTASMNSMIRINTPQRTPIGYQGKATANGEAGQ